jgi:hypothetical protein
VVIVIDSNQVSELQVTSHTGSLRSNALHGTTIAKDHVCVIAEEFKARLVEDSGRMRLGNRKSDGIGKTLAKWAGCNLDSGSVVGFGVARSDTIDLLMEI